MPIAQSAWMIGQCIEHMKRTLDSESAKRESELTAQWRLLCISKEHHTAQ